MTRDPNRVDGDGEAQRIAVAASASFMPARLRKSRKTVVLSIRTLKFEQSRPPRAEVAAPCMKRSCEA
jgi:hypothetical protein